ncbi:MAG TPA: M23 family metallopeptidase [Frankiaceae bacterium]|nr:M23 family metallopeptidase [Frankiaceae bacterium]
MLFRSRLSLVSLVTTASVAVLGAPAGAADYRPADYAYSTATVVVPMTFPVVGPVSYSDTFLACRSGCARKHMGQDLMGPKMNVAVAAFNGVIWSVKRETTVGEGNYLTLKGDNGWSANYIHMNNDTPGTDDGKGTAKYFTAAGIGAGKRVFAGEILGWIGDSGNAESTGPHLHFELRKGEPWGGVVHNAYPSLRNAKVLTRPTTSGPHPHGSYVKGCAGDCPIWRLASGKRQHVKPEVAAQWALDPRSVIPVTPNEILWYPRAADLQLPGGRAYKDTYGKVWLVTGGRRYAVPDAAALRALGIVASRVRGMPDRGLRTVPVATDPLPENVLYDGALLRVPDSTTSYWYLAGGQRRLITDAATLKSWGLQDADAITLPAPVDETLLPPLGLPLRYRDGAVVKDSYGRRYVVSNGTRRTFGSAALRSYYGYAAVVDHTPGNTVIARLPIGARLP